MPILDLIPSSKWGTWIHSWNKLSGHSILKEGPDNDMVLTDIDWIKEHAKSTNINNILDPSRS